MTEEAMRQLEERERRREADLDRLEAVVGQMTANMAALAARSEAEHKATLQWQESGTRFLEEMRSTLHSHIAEDDRKFAAKVDKNDFAELKQDLRKMMADLERKHQEILGIIAAQGATQNQQIGGQRTLNGILRVGSRILAGLIGGGLALFARAHWHS